MALPSPDEVLKKNKTNGLPSPSEVLGGHNSGGLPTPDDVLQPQHQLAAAGQKTADHSSQKFVDNLYAGTKALANPQKKQPVPKPKLQTQTNNSFTPVIQSRQALQTAIDANKGKNYSAYASEPPIIRDIHRGLDWVGQKTKPADDVALEYYTPGAGLSVLKAAEQGAAGLISKVAPGLGKSLGGKVAKRALTEAMVGAPTAAGQTLTQTGDLKEAAKQGLYGAGLGLATGGLGTLASGGIQKGVQSLRNTLKGVQVAQMGAIDSAARSGLPMNVRRTLTPDTLPRPNVLSGEHPAVTPISAHSNASTIPHPDELKFAQTVKTSELPSLDNHVNWLLGGHSDQAWVEQLIKDGRQIVDEHPVPNSNPVSPGPQVKSATTLEIPVSRNQNAATKNRGFVDTLLESEKPPQGFKERLQSAYKPVSNEETLVRANKRINKDVEEATSYVLGSTRFSAEKAAVAQRLIDHYNAQGNYQRAVDVAQKVSEEATKAGQSIQALSMFNRLTAEGILIHAQRIARKTNEAIPIGAKEVKVTEEMAANIVGLTHTTRKMSGISDLSNNVMDILERAKTGAKLSETDTQELRRFVNESRQFVEETTRKPKAPRPPRQHKDKRVRDSVVSYLDAQEQAAKERLRARGIRISSTPLDVWADYAIIGASKMGKGTVKFADWSEQMAKDLGEEIRPHLANLYERSREAFESSTKKVTQRTISEAEKLTEKAINSKQLAPAEADSLRTLAQKVSGLSGEEKRIASQDLQVVLQSLERTGILKKVSTIQTVGQLMNPKTHVRNALGNELFYRLERMNKYVSTPIDFVRSKITGGERTVTFRTNNQGEYWKNWMLGLKAGWKGVNINGLETQFDLSGFVFRSKYNPLRYLEKTLGAALKSFDTAAYMRAYNDTVGEMATLRAINEGKRGNKDLIQKYILTADDNVTKIADEYGKYVTLQDNNVISKGLSKLKRGLNLGKDFGVGDLVLKYPKTPGALLMRALEYSPAGLIRSAAILARPIFKLEPNTAEVTQALSRAIVGTAGLSGMGYLLLSKGILTGDASKDKDIRDLQRAAGQGQYQVNMSALMRLVKSGFDSDAAKIQEDDFLYTYDWMQPVSMAVSIGANTAKNIKEGKGTISGVGGTIYNSVEGGLGTLTEQSVLSGLKQAAQGYPGQTVTDKIMDILSTVPSSFVPTLSNQIKQLQDNNRRETYSPSKLQQSLNVAQARIPGLAQKLPQKFDALGQPQLQNQNHSAFNIFLNPGFSSRYKLSPEAKFIVDLINETGDESLAPRVPGKSITIKGQSIKLNGDMFSRFQQLQGEETRKRISKINPGASLNTRINRTEKALRDAGDNARKQLIKEVWSPK